MRLPKHFEWIFNVVYTVFWIVTFPASSLCDILVLYITQVSPSMVFAHPEKNDKADCFK